MTAAGTVRIPIQQDRTLTIPEDFFSGFEHSTEAELSFWSDGVIIRPVQRAKAALVDILKARQREFADLDDNSGVDGELSAIRKSAGNFARNPFGES